MTAVEPRRALPSGLAAPPTHVPTVAVTPSPLPVAEGESRLLVERTRTTESRWRATRRTVLAYVALTKPRIIELLLVTTVPAMMLAQRGVPPLSLVLVTLIGGSLAAGSANALNMYLDRDIDTKMHRTENRPLVTGEVSPQGALIFGVALATPAGIGAAIFYVVHHITIQTTLFLAAGLIEKRGGSTALDKLGGLAKLSPVLAVLFLVPALNLAGIPPFSGFIGKLGLVQAGVADGGVLAWLLVGGGILTSLLTLYAVARVWNLAFWRTPPASCPPKSRSLLPPLMVAPTMALVVFGIALTVVAGPLFEVSDQAASSLMERAYYVQAVFGGGAP